SDIQRAQRDAVSQHNGSPRWNFAAPARLGACSYECRPTRLKSHQPLSPAKSKNLVVSDSFAAQHRRRLHFRARPAAPAREPTGAHMQQLLTLTMAGFRAACFALLTLAGTAMMPSAAFTANVTTYHYDNLRTGWNPNEKTLTPSTLLNGLNGKTFKLMASVPLDDQVDAQPLLVRNQTIAGQGTHDVVYVVTANNTLYAIDADTG